MENQSSSQQSSSERIEINPIQLLVNAVYVAYQRGAYSMKEAGLISQAVEYFTNETKQAKIPEVLSEENQNQKKEEVVNQSSEKIVFQSQ